MHVFWDVGYDGASLRDLRTAMGVSSASFYAAFGSKERLFRAVVACYQGSHGRVLDPLGDFTIPDREAVERALHGSVVMQTEPHHPPGCLLVLSKATPAGEGDAVFRFLAEQRAVSRSGFITRVARARGEPCPSMEATSLGTTFHSFLMGISRQARDGIGRSAMAKSVDRVMALWDQANLKYRQS